GAHPVQLVEGGLHDVGAAGAGFGQPAGPAQLFLQGEGGGRAGDAGVQVSLVPEGRDGVAEFLPSRRLGAHGSRLPKMVLLGLWGAVPGDARSGPPGPRALAADPPALPTAGGPPTPPA